MVFFANLVDYCEKPYEGEHQDQDEIPSRDMNKLTGKPVSPLDLDTRLKGLEHTVRIQWGLLAALAIGVLVSLIRVLMKI